MMKWASRFQFLKTLIVDLNTDAANGNNTNNLMGVEVMVVVVVDTVEINTDAGYGNNTNKFMAVEVMVVVVVDTVEISIDAAIIPNISDEYGFNMTAL